MKEDAVSARVTGTVKFYRPEEKYGFLTTKDEKGEPLDVYVPSYAVPEGVTLERDQEVTFKIRRSNHPGKAPVAIAVRKVNA